MEMNYLQRKIGLIFIEKKFNFNYQKSIFQ